MNNLEFLVNRPPNERAEKHAYLSRSFGIWRRARIYFSNLMWVAPSAKTVIGGSASIER